MCAFYLKLHSFGMTNGPFLRCSVALLTYKHKTHVINNDGSVLSNADVDFYIDDVSIVFLNLRNIYSLLGYMMLRLFLHLWLMNCLLCRIWYILLIQKSLSVLVTTSFVILRRYVLDYLKLWVCMSNGCWLRSFQYLSYPSWWSRSGLGSSLLVRSLIFWCLLDYLVLHSLSFPF